MNEVSNGFSALPDGFSALSMEELEQVEGGLVVIAIIGILIGMLLPAVQKIRSV